MARISHLFLIVERTRHILGREYLEFLIATLLFTMFTGVLIGL